MNFSLYIAKRYLFSKSKNTAINTISKIAALGIVVGAMALFVVLSVFSGLKAFSLSFTNVIDPELKVSSTLGKSFFVSEEDQRKIKNITGVAAFSKVIEERVLFTFAEKQEVTFLKAVDAQYKRINAIDKKLFNGNWLEDNTNQAVVGYGTAQKFSMGLLDFNTNFEVLAPKPGSGGIENPQEAFNKATLIPVGIYSISEDLDSKYVFVDLALAQELLGYSANQVSALELKLKPSANEAVVCAALQSLFKNKIKIQNRAQLNESLYKMLNTENVAVYLIFTLVIVVALFNLIGALIMMILDKKGNLKTLYNLGTPVPNLRTIFLLQGTLLSLFGGLLGIVLGIVFVFLQQNLHWIMITPTLAYPVVFSWQNVSIVLLTIMLLGCIASVIASSRVTKQLLT